VKFLVDAQLPYHLSQLLKQKGYDAIHTDDLPHKERTSDDEIREVSQNENRIVITKDDDFLDSFYVQNIPHKLLLITTGNIKNKKLYELFSKNIEPVVAMFEEYRFIELNNTDVIGRE